jgi:hypothetical protein
VIALVLVDALIGIKYPALTISNSATAPFGNKADTTLKSQSFQDNSIIWILFAALAAPLFMY